MKPRTGDVGHFHETPLVVFTWLAILGGGLAAGRIPLWLLGLVAWTPARIQGGFVALSVGAGMLVSLLHLGNRGRMLQALRRGGRSALSTEVAFAGLTTAAAFGFFIFPAADRYVHVDSLLWSITAFSGSGLLVAVAWVYLLPGQLSWSPMAAPSPLILGFVFGMLAYAKSGTIKTAATDLLAVEGSLYVLRWLLLEHTCHAAAAPVHGRLFRTRRVLLCARLLLIPLLPLTAISLNACSTALAVLALGIAVDRFAFYALALRQTTEAEVAWIEGLIENRGEPR